MGLSLCADSDSESTKESSSSDSDIISIGSSSDEDIESESELNEEDIRNLSRAFIGKSKNNIIKLFGEPTKSARAKNKKLRYTEAFEWHFSKNKVIMYFDKGLVVFIEKAQIRN
jgi:hypothetical protein